MVGLRETSRERTLAPTCPRCRGALVREEIRNDPVLKALRGFYQCKTPKCHYEVAPGAALAIPKLIQLRDRRKAEAMGEIRDQQLRQQLARRSFMMERAEVISADTAEVRHQLEAEFETLSDDGIEHPNREAPHLPPLSEETIEIDGDWDALTVTPT